MKTYRCTRDMQEELVESFGDEREYYLFKAGKYDPSKRCNELWMTARNLTWAIAKIEALGDPGAEIARRVQLALSRHYEGCHFEMVDGDLMLVTDEETQP